MKQTLNDKRLWISGIIIFALGILLESFFLYNEISTTVSGFGFSFPGFLGMAFVGLVMFVAPFLAIAYDKFKPESKGGYDVPQVPFDPFVDRHKRKRKKRS
ncbi:hypothetical protein [Leptospira ilyithenensis]|uniref:Uncharacterized protein n=1 Tax=Leptospira ilyithenensis TaxID=2484901 RepID=A0A4R9LPK9_9LEPT|nr:hypothetical protein [Leptospira ilyithenensis]TGN09759.1 hypothetical protein EHS11_11800 [Leptospira ilyithenensis]